MLKPTSKLLNPAEYNVKIANTDAATNKIAINHRVQTFFVKKLKATIKLRIPRSPRCGA